MLRGGSGVSMLTKTPRSEWLKDQLHQLQDWLRDDAPQELRAALQAALANFTENFSATRPKRRGGKRPDSGRRKEWTDARLFQLIIDFQLIRGRNPKMKVQPLCAKLTKDPVLRGRYARFKPETIRAWLKTAWREDRNRYMVPLLKYLVEDLEALEAFKVGDGKGSDGEISQDGRRRPVAFRVTPKDEEPQTIELEFRELRYVFKVGRPAKSLVPTVFIVSRLRAGATVQDLHERAPVLADAIMAEMAII